MYQSVTAASGAIYSPAVEWKAIRAHYEKLLATAKREHGATQSTIADRGGIRQNDISRLLSNDDLGPQVETFVKAVEGLGLTVSAFFAEIERSQNPSLKPLSKAREDQSLMQGGAHGTDLVSAVVPKVLAEIAYQLTKAADRTVADRSVPSARVDKSKRR